MTQGDNDERFMAAALALGRRGLGRVAPNPSVGALIVKDDLVVGRGVTGAGGRPHGETIALQEADDAAIGATMYVTLEPCSHHGQTPPCCEAIVAAGIKRLVYAIDDPNPLVAGRGAAFCHERGLDVVNGVGADAALRDHWGHILRVTRGRPMVTLKLAETADGFVAGGPHDPRLSITGVGANGFVHGLRAMHDAIMVGIGTALADDPLMTVRLPGVIAKPLRIVLDTHLRLAPSSRLALTAHESPVVVVTAADGAGPLSGIEGVEVATAPLGRDGRLNLAAVLNLLDARGLTRIFSEGGPSVAARLIESGFADDVLILTAPRPLGDEGIATMSRKARAMLSDPSRYRQVGMREIGADRLRRFERVA